MANKNNATCSICNKEYYKCLSCVDSIKNKPWQVHTCSSDHYKVFQIIRGYNTNIYTKDEAKEKFKNVDLSDLENYKDNIKSIIKEILKEEKNTIKENIMAEVVVEDNRVDNIGVDKIKTDEIKIESENTKYYRKKNFKSEVE